MNKQVWIAAGSLTIIGVNAIPVFGSSTRPGHEIFSSDKPEAIVKAQEEKRQEYRRLIWEQKEQRERRLNQLKVTKKLQMTKKVKRNLKKRKKPLVIKNNSN